MVLASSSEASEVRAGSFRPARTNLVPAAESCLARAEPIPPLAPAMSAVEGVFI